MISHISVIRRLLSIPSLLFEPWDISRRKTSIINTSKGGVSSKKMSCAVCPLGLVLAEAAWLGRAMDEGQRAFP